MGAKTSQQFRRIPVGKMALVYFMSIDYVLGRTEMERRAWRFKCHFPKSLFVNKTGRPGKKRVSNRCYDYPLFKRMVATKEVVYKNHRKCFACTSTSAKNRSCPSTGRIARSKRSQRMLKPQRPPTRSLPMTSFSVNEVMLSGNCCRQCAHVT